ncbi:hypothetical protein LRY60_03820 [Candidatus Woesebacteria bacterium]|nr:hypothetical protein [Candidatus Woesebacteria bacterium]
MTKDLLQSPQNVEGGGIPPQVEQLGRSEWKQRLPGILKELAVPMDADDDMAGHLKEARIKAAQLHLQEMRELATEMYEVYQRLMDGESTNASEKFVVSAEQKKTDRRYCYLILSARAGYPSRRF